MDTPVAPYWEENSVHNNLKYERCSIGNPSPNPCKEEQATFRYCDTNGNLNFTTAVTSEDDEYHYHKKKISRDPMSHRIIEKRRRDRMNNCLADLSRLIPADYLKKGRGRIEKTEIIEMAIKHMKHLQAHTCSHIECGVENRPTNLRHNESDDTMSPLDSLTSKDRLPTTLMEHYRHGYHECLSETIHFLIEVEGFYAHDSLCVSLVNHLRKHCDQKSDRIIANGDIRPVISSVESTNGALSPGSTTEAGTITNCKVTNGDAGSSSCSSEGGNSTVNSIVSRGLEDSMDGHHPSQLRNILTCPTLSTHSHSMSRIQLSVESPASPSTTVVNSCASSSESNQSSSGGVVYKFKNNIKKRFTAEHHSTERSGTRSTNGIASTQSDTIGRGTKRPSSIDVQTETITPPHPIVPIKYTSLPSVPIFALHSQGSYYIPLTVDRDVLSPYLNELSLDTQPANIASVVLHPVTISVNFHSKNPIYSSTQMNSNSLVNPVNGFVPLPKWRSFTPDRS